MKRSASRWRQLGMERKQLETTFWHYCSISKPLRGGGRPLKDAMLTLPQSSAWHLQKLQWILQESSYGKATWVVMGTCILYLWCPTGQPREQVSSSRVDRFLMLQFKAPQFAVMKWETNKFFLPNPTLRISLSGDLTTWREIDRFNELKYIN